RVGAAPQGPHGRGGRALGGHRSRDPQSAGRDRRLGAGAQEIPPAFAAGATSHVDHPQGVAAADQLHPPPSPPPPPPRQTPPPNPPSAGAPPKRSPSTPTPPSCAPITGSSGGSRRRRTSSSATPIRYARFSGTSRATPFRPCPPAARCA